MTIEFLKLHDDVELPVYGTEFSSGFDLLVHNFKFLYHSSNSPVEAEDNAKKSGTLLTLFPGDRALVGCGFKMAIPVGYEMQVRPRSGKTLKQGLTVLNAPGTVDSDYRGEVGIILINHSRDIVLISKGEAVAQGVIQAIEKINWKVVTELSDTVRGEGGFGSTNK